MFLGPSLCAHSVSSYISISFSPAVDWAGNLAAEDSPLHIAQLSGWKWTDPVSSDPGLGRCLGPITEWVGAHHRVGQHQPGDRTMLDRHGPWIANTMH